MTRDEYLMTLKGGLNSLSEEEQVEAIKYYSDYFDEINDDAKVISELGSPSDVAAIIIENFKSTHKAESDDNENSDDFAGSECEQSQNSSYSSATDYSNGLYYEFDSVKSLDFNFGAAEVVVIKGEKFSIETRGLEKENLNCFVNHRGTLVINNRKKINLNWFNHNRSSSLIPRILLTFPVESDETKVENFRICVGAGTFISENVPLSFKKAKIDVGAGSIVLNKLNGSNLDVRCGMGSASVKGKLTGLINVDCSMGSVKFDLKGSASDYSLDAKVGLGDVRFNDDKKSGIGQMFAEVKKDNHFSVVCGMGSVNISVYRF